MDNRAILKQLLYLGLTYDQASTVIGIIAEERQIADREGYHRGYNHGSVDQSITNPQKQKDLWLCD
jgi:hypothetical protein